MTEPVPAPRDVWGPPAPGSPQPVPAPTVAYAPVPPPGWGDPQAVAATRGTPKPSPLANSAVRMAAVSALIAGVLGATLAVGLADVAGGLDNGTGATVSLKQSGSADPGSPVPGSIAAIAAAVLPSVVTIQEISSQVQGTGSGVVIDGSKGLILTNDHVIADAAADKAAGQVEVIPSGGTPADAEKATVVGADATTDLAVIQVPDHTLKTATLGRSSSLRVGDAVIAIGAPLGLSGTVTSGIVSYLGRNVPVPSETGSGAGNELTGSIQTDAAINPGNSGGALVDSQGRVVGINSAIASTGTTSDTQQSGNIGVGFAIPIDEATTVAAQLIAPPHRATHPFLGVRTQDSASPVGAKISSVDDGTQTLPGVTAGSPADRAGLQEGDVITSLDGDRITGADDLLAAVRRHKVGETVTLTVIRNGSTMSVKVTLADNSASH